MPSEEHQEPDTPGPAARVRTIVSGELHGETSSLDRHVLDRAGDEGRLIWVDLVNPQKADLETLRHAYGLHPLAVGEVFQHHRTSAASSFNGVTHVVAQYPDLSDETISAKEIQAIIGTGFFITIHGAGVLDTDAVLGHWEATPQDWRSTSSSLLYATFRVALAEFGPVADRLDENVTLLEEEAVHPHNAGTPKRQLLYRLFNATEQITDLHNIAAPLQDAMRSLEHNSNWFDHEHGNAYTRDVVDDAYHLARRLQMLTQTAERLFEMVNSLITLQRNDVSKQLTIVATIFLPLSFLGTYFGQNFRYMTDAVSGGAAFLVWGVLAPLASLLVIVAVMWKVGAFR